MGGRLLHDPPTGRMRVTITAADLLDAVKGLDLLEPFPQQSSGSTADPGTASAGL